MGAEGSGLSTVAPRYIDASTITLGYGRAIVLGGDLGNGGGEEENESGGDDRKHEWIRTVSGSRYRYVTP